MTRCETCGIPLPDDWLWAKCYYCQELYQESERLKGAEQDLEDWKKRNGIIKRFINSLKP